MTGKSVWIVALVVTLGACMANADPLPGDLDGDGVVGFDDFLVLARNFGKTGDPAGPGAVFVTVYDTIKVDRVSFSQNIVITTSDGGLLDTLIVRSVPVQTSGGKAEASETLRLDVSGIVTPVGEETIRREAVYRDSLARYSFAIPSYWSQGESSVVLSNIDVEEAAILVGVTPYPRLEITDADIDTLESSLSFIPGYHRQQIRSIALGGIDAREIVWTASPSEVSLKGKFVLGVDGGYLYMVTLSALDNASYDRFEGDFKYLVESFRAGTGSAAKVSAVAQGGIRGEWARSVSGQLLKLYVGARAR